MACRPGEHDYHFVERPSQDFLCPVSLELLLEPQQTSCCGNHLSLEAATRLRTEGKPCPMCNEGSWNAVLDKYHRRKVHEVRVYCWHKGNGCEWVGELNSVAQHATSCEHGLWKCEYCGLRCEFVEGGEKHWSTCPKFPEPCPNSCEVGSVERCNMEQHRSECSLEPVACEMKEFGCSVVVPRKELARHMRESELQHLIAMTMLNLRLTRQLQQESTERDKKIENLQQEIHHQKKQHVEICAELKLQIELQNVNFDEHKRELAELKAGIHELEQTTKHIEQHTSGGACSVCKVFFFDHYRQRKCSDDVLSAPFYSHHHGYKFSLKISYNEDFNDIGAHLYLMVGEYDDDLQWPMKGKVQLELLNQAGDHRHVVRRRKLKLTKDKRDSDIVISESIIKYSSVEHVSTSIQYIVNNCLKFRVHVSTFREEP